MVGLHLGETDGNDVETLGATNGLKLGIETGKLDELPTNGC
jgi:hypothetical protein